MNYLRPSIVLLLFITLITGLIYPLAVTGLAHLFFPQQSNGSLITVQNKVVGSALIGQTFSQAGYFSGRPSATSSEPYNPLASGGSNLAGSNPLLKQRIDTDIQRLRQSNPEAVTPVPAELVLASASGLDPHITPQSAEFQVQRIASARHLTPEQVRQLIKLHTQTPLSILGEPVVNVLELNLALDNATQVGQ
ncbi:potassium-transporting ATPase subunit KdpC [Budviciaceae bacterium CWB-B4]|uniref:Potassium-transporting ATPase KdpC subunit n=1 Tax=Limnobaculum xujianqingii TaxID=2738837 RepID=A0A9D7AEV5_9GAMM|nr:potassium-transporting ATPase subunit KdpC [Limnobaculum xujianqingii]MBK5071440.1 potassium-transporting ATPase subunit KdpC [Limnobaculum xujianqingii]MBK5174749.1 potassium-transporting ATPase subunit KdpC [Limnobaculum xujianqingii]